MARPSVAVTIAFSLLFASGAFADQIFISFEERQGNYIPTPGVLQEVTDQFVPLGLTFRDRKSPGRGGILGQCGIGFGQVSLFGFGNDFSGCGDTRPDLDVLFVDPTDPARAAFTDAFSIVNTDGLLQLSAYDRDGVLLGSTSAFDGVLSVSGVGRIFRINLLSIDQDPTTLDNITFNAVTPVPEPTTIMLLLSGLGLGVGVARRRAPRDESQQV